MSTADAFSTGFLALIETKPEHTEQVHRLLTSVLGASEENVGGVSWFAPNRRKPAFRILVTDHGGPIQLVDQLLTMLEDSNLLNAPLQIEQMHVLAAKSPRALTPLLPPIHTGSNQVATGRPARKPFSKLIAAFSTRLPGVLPAA